MKTKALIELYKGSKTFSIWAVDEDGNKVSDYPVISFGAKKALSLFNHIEEFKAFVDEAVQIEQVKDKLRTKAE